MIPQPHRGAVLRHGLFHVLVWNNRGSAGCVAFRVRGQNAPRTRFDYRLDENERREIGLAPRRAWLVTLAPLWLTHLDQFETVGTASSELLLRLTQQISRVSQTEEIERTSLAWS